MLSYVVLVFTMCTFVAIRLVAIDSMKIQVRIAVFIDSGLKKSLVERLNMSGEAIGQLTRSYVDQINFNLDKLNSDHISAISLSLVHQSSYNRSHIGDIDTLLSDFCFDQSRESASGASWDFGLLLTSRNLFSGSESDSAADVIGISPVGGIRWSDLSCALVELNPGSRSQQLLDGPEGRVYPTRSLAGSALVATHEFGHNLGIHHDGWPFEVDCSETTGTIMAPIGGVESMGQSWSRCSRAALDRLDLARFRVRNEDSTQMSRARPFPGQNFDLNFQCRFFGETLLEPTRPSARFCNETVLCKSSTGQIVPIGSALMGSVCSDTGDSLCLSGECRQIDGQKLK